MGKTYKRIFITIVTILSMLAYIFIDFTPIITAQAASTYKLTVSWGEGIEWVATDKDGVNRWTNGSTKSFSENTSAYTYIKLKPGYRLDCLSADAEWADWTTVSNNLVYDTWFMYNNRTVSIKVISDVFKENGERYTYNGNYSETGYKLVEVSSWECTHSLSLDNDIIGYIESNPNNIDEGERLKPENSELLASIRTYTSDSRYKLRIGSAYVKYTGAACDRYGNIASGNKYVSQYTLYVDSHNIANETGLYPEYGASKNNDWLLATNYRCPDIDAGEEADYAGFAYYRNYYAYCKTTQMWYPVGSAHNWLGCAKGDIGANEFHPGDYTHTITKYKLVPVDYSISYNLNGGSVSENPTTYNVETNTFTLKNPTKPGYTFTGWTGSNGTTPQTTVSISKGSTGDKSYAANWKPKTYTIRVNPYLPSEFTTAPVYSAIYNGNSNSIVEDDGWVKDSQNRYTKTFTYDQREYLPAMSSFYKYTGYDRGQGWKLADGTYVSTGWSRKNLSSTEGDIIDIYPNLSPKDLYINFDGNGGTVNVPSYFKQLHLKYDNYFWYENNVNQQVRLNFGDNMPVTANKPGYIFTGWTIRGAYFVNSTMKIATANTRITSSNPTTAIARYEPITYTVRLHIDTAGDGASYVINKDASYDWTYNESGKYFERVLTYDATQDFVRASAVVSAAGYNLIDGWYTQDGKNIFDGYFPENDKTYEEVWNLTPTSGHIIDLYAKWSTSTSTYKVNYLLQNIGDDNYTLKESAEYTETINASVTPTVKTYTGFTSPVAQTVQVKGDGTTVVNYYYTRNPYLLTVNAGTGINSITVSNSAGINNIENTDKKKVLSVRYGASVTINADISPGYSWLRWDGSFTQTEKSYSFEMPANEQTLTARATAGQVIYKVNYWLQDIGDDNYTLKETTEVTGTTDTYVTPTVKTYTGFTSPTAQTVQVKGDGTTVVNYYYTRNSYLLTVSAGTGISSVTVSNSAGLSNIENTDKKKVLSVRYGASVTINADINPGYSWSRWDGSFTQWNKSYNFYMPAKAVNVTAIATANKYVVQLYANKPSDTSNLVVNKLSDSEWVYDNVNGCYTSTFTYDAAKNIPSPADTYSLKGYSASGWYTSATGGNNIFSGNMKWNLTTSYNGVVKLYARWTENEYKISFNYVKPDNASGDIQNNEIKEKNVKYNKPVGNLPEPTLTGWKFDGWYTAVTGGIKFTSDTKYLNTENIVLYPHWTANKYTITFDSNEPAGSTDSVTGSMSNIYCTYDVPVQIPDNNFALRGWDFVAWNTKADGSGIRYLANDTVSNLTSTDGATVTLYAEWDTHIEWNASLSKANKSFVNAMELSFEDKAVNWPDGIGYGIVMNNTLTYKEFGDMQGFLNVNISNVYPKSIKYEFSDSRINEVVLNDRAYVLTKINGKSTFEFMVGSSLTREFVQNISFTLPEYEAESDVISDKEYSAYVDISVTYQIYSTNREVAETRRVYYNVTELDLSRIHSRIRYQPGQVR